jgi:hypothetical protein
MMKNALLVAAALAMALTACSQSGTGLPLGAQSAGSPSAAAAAAKRRGSIRIAIKVPKKKRYPRPRFVSPSTKSLQISITPIAGGQAIVKDVNVSGASLQVSVPLDPGKYLASVSTYDAVNDGGNCLSSGQALPFTIVGGQADSIALVLGGVAHSYLVEADNAGGSFASGFTVPGATQQTFTFAAEDADGNYILGAGTPVYDLSISGSGWSITPKQTSTSNTNRFAVTPPNVNGSSANVTIKVDDPGLCALAGSACTTSFGLKNVELQNLYVAICSATCGGSWGPDKVSIFASPYTGQPIATITNGVEDPRDVAVDKTGNVFVLNNPPQNGSPDPASVTEYSPSNGYASPVATMTAGLQWPTRIALDAQDDVIVMNGMPDTYDYPAIFTASSNYTAAPILIKMQLLRAIDMRVNAQGTIIVAQCGASCNESGIDGIAQFPQPYSATEVPTFIQDVDPLSLTIDPSGNLWVGECEHCTVQASDVAEHLPEGNLYSSTITNMADETSYIDGPVAIAVDSAKNLYVADDISSNYPGLNVYGPPYTGAPNELFAQQVNSRQLDVDATNQLIMEQNETDILVAAPPYTSYFTIVQDYGTPTVLGQATRYVLGAAP